MSLPEYAADYLTAAVAADGARVLGLPAEVGADTPELLGRRLLQAVFGRRDPGDDVPAPLAELVAGPGEPSALRALEDHVGGILADQPELDATVTRLVADTWRRWAAAGDAHAMTGLGTLLKWQDDLDGARAWFERAVDAGYDQALLDLAVLLDGFIGDTDAAIASLRRAARSSDPDVAAEGAGQLAQTLCQHGDLPAARAAFQAAIDTGHPEWAPDAMVWLGACLEKHGDHDGAKTAWQRAIAAGHPHHAAHARCRLGDLLLEEGDQEGARAAWQPVISSGDQDWAPVAYADLVNMLRDAGDIGGIHDAYRLALRSGIPDAPYGLMIIGNVLDEQGDTPGAHAAWQEAIDAGIDEFFADALREQLSPPARYEPDPAELAALPPRFHPHNIVSTGIDVLTNGLPALPAEPNYLMAIPIACWAAGTCGVVVFLQFHRIHAAARPTPLALRVTYSRTSTEWVAHKHVWGSSFGPDPIADPDDLRDLDGRPMVIGGSSHAAEPPPPGVPATILIGRAAPQVTGIALIQDGHETRRRLDSNFGAWVVCTERSGPFQVAALDGNGAVLATIDHPARPHPPDGRGIGA